MQKKKDNFLEKIVKKNYNTELENVLEKKYFEENTKSILLSIMYKIETAYKDYKQVKRNVETKEEFIENLIEDIQRNCESIKLVKLHSKEDDILGDRTFLIEKKAKKIICYPIERKLLYAIAKISKNDEIIKDKYYIINKTLSNLINIGKDIETVEPLRDFNGYSWTTISGEIESLEYNLIYQNLRIILGYKFLNKWIRNTEYIIDYMELLKNKLEELYGNEVKEKIIEYLEKISILLEMKYNKNAKEKILQEKIKNEEKLDKILDNAKFVQEITEKKKALTKQIKKIDETLNNDSLLQSEYEKRNEDLPLEEKIFSMRILSKIMAEERESKIKKIEKLNDLLNPQKFIEYKKLLERKEEKLKVAQIKDIQKEIEKCIIKFQEIFLKAFITKVEKANSKQEIEDLIYEYRYYNLLQIKDKIEIKDEEKLKDKLKETTNILLRKAEELKVLNQLSKDEEKNYQILKNIFETRSINLNELYIKIVRENEKYYLQIFDENAFEEKIELKLFEQASKEEIPMKLNKKVKIFN